MCRFALYLGPEIRVSSLITDPKNSIIHQSFHAHERIEPLNGDGFGIAWYPGGDDHPAVYKSMAPAWSNRNLRQIARVTRTQCLLAHVRAATPPLPVTDLNCHPFADGRLTFMHNGDLGGFTGYRRELLAGLTDESFSKIEGSTDSEHMFAMFLDRYRAIADDEPPLERLATAMNQCVRDAEALRREHAPDRHGLLNLVACDGERAVVTRYVSEGGIPNTLYFRSGRAYICEGGVCRMEEDGTGSVVVASEPLDESGRWTRVELGHMVLVEGGSVSVRALDLR